MKRLAELTYEELSVEQRDVWDALVSGPRQGVAGPFPALLRRPEFANLAQTMGLYLRYGSLLPRRVVELVVLMVTREWHSEYPWNAHVRMALTAGFSEETVEAIRLRTDPKLDDAKERAVHKFLAELLLMKRVSDTTYAETISSIGEPWVVDVLGLSGYYMMVSMIMNTFDSALPKFI